MPDIYISEPAQGEKTKKEGPKIPLSVANKRSYNPLGAYLVNPVGVRFGIQEPEEHVILLLRKHWITNIPWLLLALIFFFAPLVLGVFPLISFLPANFQLMAVIAWYLLLTAFILEKFLSWFFNAYIVTDERIIDIDFYNLIYRQVTEAQNDKIQDITYRIGGVVRSLFNYGDVLIQTAGALPNLDFNAVPNPDQIVKILNELREQAAEREEGEV